MGHSLKRDFLRSRRNQITYPPPTTTDFSFTRQRESVDTIYSHGALRPKKSGNFNLTSKNQITYSSINTTLSTQQQQESGVSLCFLPQKNSILAITKYPRSSPSINHLIKHNVPTTHSKTLGMSPHLHLTTSQLDPLFPRHQRAKLCV